MNDHGFPVTASGSFDILVIGGGNAGCTAAIAAARLDVLFAGGALRVPRRYRHRGIGRAVDDLSRRHQ